MGQATAGVKSAAATPRLLGRTGLKLSTLSLGTTGLGNYPSRITDDAAGGAVAAALASGYRMFDTAPLYGRGLAERRLGLALRAAQRDKVIVATKIGRLLVPSTSRRFSRDPGASMFVDPAPFDTRFDYSYDGAMRSIEDSLQRLGMARIDIVHIHNIDPANHSGEKCAAMFRQCMEGAYKALDKLKTEKVIRAIGVGNNSSDMLRRFAAAGNFDCFLLAGQYNLLDQSALDGLFDDCAKRRIDVLLGGVFASGILATASRGRPMQGYSPASDAACRRVASFESICARHGVSLAAAAIHFALAPKVVRSVVLGAASPGQVLRNAAAARERIPAGFWEEMRERRMIDPRCPPPPRAAG